MKNNFRWFESEPGTWFGCCTHCVPTSTQSACLWVGRHQSSLGRRTAVPRGSKNSRCTIPAHHLQWISSHYFRYFLNISNFLNNQNKFEWITFKNRPRKGGEFRNFAPELWIQSGLWRGSQSVDSKRFQYRSIPIRPFPNSRQNKVKIRKKKRLLFSVPNRNSSNYFHSLVNQQRKTESTILLRQHFLRPQLLYTPGNLDKFLIGLATQPSQDFDNNFSEEVKFTFLKANVEFDSFLCKII